MGTSGKQIRIKITGFSSVQLTPVKLNFSFPESATLQDVFDYVNTEVEGFAMGDFHEYSFRYQSSSIFLAVDDVYIDAEQWSTFIPPDGCEVHFIPPVADG